MTSVVLIRYGEIFLKGGNRSFFEKRLLDAARRALAPLPGARVDRLHGRLLAWPGEAGAAKAVRALERVFGIQSLSPARVVPRELAAITAAAIEEAGAAAGGGKPSFTGEASGASRGASEAAVPPRMPSFKVESRRSDKRFQPASPEISRQVGASIVAALGLPVDLHHPQFVVGVEVGFEHAFVFAQTVAGPGGLPTGTGGRVELLLSGGIDSPVAGWLMLRRGCTLSATYFHSPPYTGDKAREKVAQLARRLGAWQQSEVRLTVVGFTDAQKALREASGDGRLAVVLYRRMMLRVAERIARAGGAQALITGEALGQVASQTLENMVAIDEAATMPVLRPCLSHDKQDTIALARRIDTYETSIEPYDDCCSLFVPEHPETKARLDRVHAAEAKLDITAMADELARSPLA